MFGQTVKTFFQSTILPSGSYNINLPGDSLADGFYVVRLDIGSTKNITKKVAKIDSTSGITDNKGTDKILIFPNPTNDLLTIPVTGDKTIILTDLNGKVLKSFTTNRQVISLLNFAAGQYVIAVLTDKNELITTQKILKSE